MKEDQCWVKYFFNLNFLFDLTNFNIYFLKFLGKIETYKKEWATEGDRMPIVKRKDNLKFEGHFEAPQEQKWAPGERAPIIK